MTTKNGNYFYILIDRDDEGEDTVHFLKQRHAALLSGSFRHLCPSARYPFPYGFLCIVCAEGFKAGEAFLSGGAA